MMPICFVDTETTGLHQDKQLWEVAIIRRDFDAPADQQYNPGCGYRQQRYEAFVPVDLSNADLFGLNVGHFYERHPAGRFLSGRENDVEVGRFEKTFARDVAFYVARFTHGARFIGAAPSFDAEVLGDFLRKHGLLPTWHHRLVDTHDLAIGYLIGKNIIRKDRAYEAKKDELSVFLGIKPHNNLSLVHTAMGDAQHEADIWDAIMS